jgi:hypothetical protein
MCTMPAIEGPSANAASTANFADIINQVNEILPFYATKSKPLGILLPSKHSCCVKIDDPSIPSLPISDDSSAASIGSSIEPKLSYDVDSFIPFDLPTSA